MWVNEGCNEVSAEGNRGDNRDIFFHYSGVSELLINPSKDVRYRIDRNLLILN
jgi:hypothetical protein